MLISERNETFQISDSLYSTFNVKIDKWWLLFFVGKVI
jgi:hypothetical protein